MNFSAVGLNKNIQKAIADLGFETLTPIQKEAIPHLMEHKTDLVALAQTGTGKTAAFGLPILHKIDVKRKFPQAIILCPTRELCLQISKDMQTYSKYIKSLKITPVYGGANILTQIKLVKTGTQIIVGTPGRVIDLINRKALRLQDIEFVILDEADEMLNMGFKEDLDKILGETPEDKQTLLFSATMPKEVLKISKNYMFNSKTIEVASRNEGTKNVDHHYYMVNARDKYKALRRICDINPNIYAIVFCRTRRETADVADKLMQDGYNSDAIHGELSQSQRTHVMNKFRQKKIQLLVATDVAARGIDIENLTHVINYNLPDDNEVYVHRSGRTGRAGNKGVSIIISHSRDGKKLKDIQRMIKRDLILKKVPNGDEICQIQLMRLVDKVATTKINQKIENYFPSIEEKLAHLDKNNLIKHFLSTEFNRLFSFYSNAIDLNVSASKKNRIEKSKKQKREKIGYAEQGHTRFFINLGKEKGLKTHNLIGLINEYTKNRNIPIGKIDIMKRFSFFEVPSDYANDILTQLSHANWNGNKVNTEISQVPGSKSSNDSKNRKERGYGRHRKLSGGRKRENNRSLKIEKSNLNKRGSTKKKNKISSDNRGFEGSSFKERFNAVGKINRKR